VEWITGRHSSGEVLNHTDPKGDISGGNNRNPAAGIRIGKVQVTSGLRFKRVVPGIIYLLKLFDDVVYLHQVVECNKRGLTPFIDLAHAFASLRGGPTANGASISMFPCSSQILGRSAALKTSLSQCSSNRR
jgi:hypothetical protein